MQRQKEGIDAQRANGTYTGGRPRINVDEEKFVSTCQRWQAGKITAIAAINELGMTRTTFYRRAKERGYNTNAPINPKALEKDNQ